MALKFEINADEILAQFETHKAEIKEGLEKALENLATLTYARIVEETDVLSSSVNKIYRSQLSGPEEVAPHVWVISLGEKALWIEEGIPPNHDMKPDLLKGKHSRVIPFHYDKPSSSNTPLTNALVSEIKQKLRKEKLSISKIEKGPNGSPRSRRLHEFSFTDKSGKNVSWVGRKPEHTHALSKVNIYQHINKQTGSVRRDVLVFRTVTDGPASSGKWIYPGYDARKFMDKAMEKAEQDWENKILPEILSKWSGA